jgi:hypothetical protein
MHRTTFDELKVNKLIASEIASDAVIDGAITVDRITVENLDNTNAITMVKTSGSQLLTKTSVQSGNTTHLNMDFSTYNPLAHDPAGRIRFTDDNWSNRIGFYNKQGGAIGNALVLSCEMRYDYVNFPVGVRFLTSGGTAATLNYYEEFTEATTLTGPFAAPIATTIRINRIGKMCMLNVDPNLDAFNAAAPIQVTALIPARLRPVTNGGSNIIASWMPVINNGATVAGSIFVSNGGLIQIGVAINGNFTAGTCGFSETPTVSWRCA